jgi:hypothetical protein
VFVVGTEREHRTGGPQPHLNADVLGVAPGGGLEPVVVADDDRALTTFEFEPRQLGVMLKSGRAVARGLGLRHPELDPVQRP